MEATKLQVKLFLEPDQKVELERLVAVWHDWIRTGELAELLIDVADYSHVHQGPAVLLVGHAADYAMDFGGGRPGILYSRKRDASGPLGDRIEDALRRALTVCAKLEASLGLTFRGDELVFRINDRLNAPNVDATLAEVRGPLESALAKLYAGSPFSIEREGTERELFGVHARSEGAPGVRALLPRIG